MEGTGNPNPWPLAGGLTALALLTIVGGIFFVGMGLQPAAVAAPTSYARFTSGDKSFSCEYPEGWEQVTSESHAVQSAARFRKGGAQITIDSDLTMGIIGDLNPSAGMPPELSGGGMGIPDMPTGGGGAEVPGMPSLDGIPTMEKVEGALEAMKKPAIERLHDANRKTYEIAMRDYEEQAAQPFQTPAGEARLSEFTAKDGILGSTVRGYRATILGRDRGITVFAKCSDGNWAALQPAFTRVIHSIGPGGG
jgi:hypothetical protein